MDSAAANLILARNSDTQAVFPIRGKILSVRKATIDKALANQEIVNIIKALGLDLDPKTCSLTYDEKKLRYGKIMLGMDADPDGAAIKSLVISLMWWLCPELVQHGHIWVCIPPLFRITTKKNEYIFLKDGDALEQYKRTHVGEKYLINRNKGLGE